ncbi:MAG: peptidase Ste24p [Acidobacteria bacterium]|nr:peptidase Ste24p [Acidobacteriota bacterium]
MLKILILLAIILLFIAGRLPRLGDQLGRKARKPVKQAKWMWSSFAGTEDEALKAEREYGRECAREFAQQFPGNGSRQNQELVATVGAKLGSAVGDPRLKFDFKVVSSNISNAFALPGGFVFITEPLIDLCKHDADEIAFFLGHEIGHIRRSHAKDKLTTDMLLNIVMTRLSGAGQMIRQMVGKGYSRELELEADREAVQLASIAGFDPSASVRALQRLAQVAPDNSGLLEYFSSHPAFPERVQALEQHIQKA